jgi:hypothetical protein
LLFSFGYRGILRNWLIVLIEILWFILYILGLEQVISWVGLQGLVFHCIAYINTAPEAILGNVVGARPPEISVSHNRVRCNTFFFANFVVSLMI